MKQIISIFFIISAIFITSCDEAKTDKNTKRKERPCPAPVKKECNSCSAAVDTNEALEIDANDKISAKAENIVESNEDQVVSN
jgi:hypothetical protein